jgi:uncharacterized protein
MATVEYGDFEWDDAKAQANLRKHGVTFEEASTVFSDHSFILLPDPVNPARFLALGLSALARILVVVHIERGPRVRLISARKAARREQETYERRGF